MFLELDALIDLTRIAVDQEAIRGLLVLEHGVSNHAQDNLVGHEHAFLHQVVQMFASGRTRFDLLAEQITTRQMCVAVFVRNLLTLRAFATARTADHKYHMHVVQRFFIFVNWRR